MSNTHPKVWLAYLLLAITAQSGLYRFYLGTTGSAAVMLAGFVLIPTLAISAGEMGTLIALGIAALLTVVVVTDIFRLPGLVRAAHSKGTIQ